MSSDTTHPSMRLLETSPLFKPAVNNLLLPLREQIYFSYERAKAIGLCYDMQIEDVVNLSSKFWNMHIDPIAAVDGAATTLLTIQYNLVAGTLARHLPEREDLLPILNDLLRYRQIGQFCLTEQGHGLDAENMETTATMQPNGDFILHSPTPSSAKFMPPTVPMGVPCIAIVFARLIVNGEFRGIKPFVVNMNDGRHMCPGISAKLLPTRQGTHPVNHSLTYFSHVYLPSTALLGTYELSDSPKLELLQSIWRVAVGTLALSGITIPCLQICSTIGYLYSKRRTVGSVSKAVPIFSFRTQQIPIITGIAYAHILQAFYKWATSVFSDDSLDPRVQHGVATCLKVVSIQLSEVTCLAIAKRCGAQGVFAANQIMTMHNELQGIAIAEGDTLVLSIRLATELLLGRYELPATSDPSSPLSQHEVDLFSNYAQKMPADQKHRNAQTNHDILPFCQPLVEAAAHRMAYDAAVSAGVMPCLLSLYTAQVVKMDSAWYSENAGLTRQAQLDMESKAIDDALPHIEQLVDDMNATPYITAPIISDAAWNGWVDELQKFGSKSQGYIVTSRL